MDIKTQGYNVAEVTLSSAVTPGTKTEVGTAKEFEQLAKLVQNSGLMIVSGTIGGNAMRGSVLANYYSDANVTGIDFGGITNFGYTPSIIAGSLEIESDGKAYVTLTITPVSTSKTTRKASAE